MGRTPIRAKRVLDAYAELKITFTFAFRNSQASAFSYIFSKKPGPSSLATRKPIGADRKPGSKISNADFESIY